MMRGLLAIVACAAATSCAAWSRGEGRIIPGDRVSTEEAVEYCQGDIARYEEEVATYREQSERTGETIVPNVGDDLCRVVAKVGEPDERASHLDGDGRQMLSFTYITGPGLIEGGRVSHHLTLGEVEGGTFEVTAVTW